MYKKNSLEVYSKATEYMKEHLFEKLHVVDIAQHCGVSCSGLEKTFSKFGENGVTRRFSWREAAAIQTFPADLEFHGDLTSKYKQIGNAVPVKLAEIIATHLYGVLSNALHYGEKRKSD